jgi:RND family efflux transporter MFP subunit
VLRSLLRPLLLASTAAALAATPACDPKASGSEQSAEAAADPIQIKSRTVSKEPMPVLMMLTGTLRAEREARVAASVAGRVDKMHVARGAQVKAGQVLAELDSSSASLSAAEAQKASQTAKVQRELAKKDCERAQQLFEAGAISKSDYDARKAQCDNAELGVEAAGIRTAIGAKMIKDASIRAPFAGTVESRDTEVGEFLLPGSRVATIVAIDKLRLEVVVPEAQLARVSVGTSLSFRVAAYKERSFSAQVTVIGATVRHAAGRRPVPQDRSARGGGAHHAARLVARGRRARDHRQDRGRRQHHLRHRRAAQQLLGGPVAGGHPVQAGEERRRRVPRGAAEGQRGAGRAAAGHRPAHRPEVRPRRAAKTCCSSPSTPPPP